MVALGGEGGRWCGRTGPGADPCPYWRGSFRWAQTVDGDQPGRAPGRRAGRDRARLGREPVDAAAADRPAGAARARLGHPRPGRQALPDRRVVHGPRAGDGAARPRARRGARPRLGAGGLHPPGRARHLPAEQPPDVHGVPAGRRARAALAEAGRPQRGRLRGRGLRRLHHRQRAQLPDDRRPHAPAARRLAGRDAAHGLHPGAAVGDRLGRDDRDGRLRLRGLRRGDHRPVRARARRLPAAAAGAARGADALGGDRAPDRPARRPPRGDARAAAGDARAARSIRRPARRRRRPLRARRSPARRACRSASRRSCTPRGWCTTSARRRCRTTS